MSLIVIACMLFVVSNVLLAQNKYIGSAKCKMCHMSKRKQHPSWSASKHVKAFEILKGEVALKIAKGKNIADTSTDAKCLKCYATASAIDSKLNGRITKEDGVSCETCHGPGSNYKAPIVMNKREDAINNGLIFPGEKLCLKCHNSESPTIKGFNYATSLAKTVHKKA